MSDDRQKKGIFTATYGQYRPVTICFICSYPGSISAASTIKYKRHPLRVAFLFMAEEDSGITNPWSGFDEAPDGAEAPPLRSMIKSSDTLQATTILRRFYLIALDHILGVMNTQQLKRSICIDRLTEQIALHLVTLQPCKKVFL